MQLGPDNGLQPLSFPVQSGTHHIDGIIFYTSFFSSAISIIRFSTSKMDKLGICRKIGDLYLEMYLKLRNL